MDVVQSPGSKNMDPISRDEVNLKTRNFRWILLTLKMPPIYRSVITFKSV